MQYIVRIACKGILKILCFRYEIPAILLSKALFRRKVMIQMVNSIIAKLTELFEP